jgi:HSP20 family molecular chaperone IbpA
MTTAIHMPSTLRVQEHADELVVELELPAGDDESFELDLDHGVLTVKVQRPKEEADHDEWRIHADATPC